MSLKYRTKIYILANEEGNIDDYKLHNLSWYNFNHKFYKVQDINSITNLYKIQIKKDNEPTSLDLVRSTIIIGCIDENQKFYRLQVSNLEIKNNAKSNKNLYLILKYDQNENKFIIKNSSHYKYDLTLLDKVPIDIQYWLTHQRGDKLATKERIKNFGEQDDKQKESAQFESKEEFLKWYIKEPKECCYCGIKEEYLTLYFNKNNNPQYYKDKVNKARQRGKDLEVERIETLNPKNVYSKENCALACYICNNAKSDFLSPKSFKPIAKGINEFWNQILLDNNKEKIIFKEDDKIWDKQ